MKKAFICFLVATAYTVSPVPLNSSFSKDHKYSRFIEFPDGEENMHNVDLEAEPSIEVINDVTRNPANNLYLLFTRRNPTTAQRLKINNPASIINSYFNPSLPTVVIAHGWLSNQNTDLNLVIRNAYLLQNDVNIIVLDWRRLAISNYVTAVMGVPAVGRGLGQFLAFLNASVGAPFSSMHLVGFSLGAHLVGNAGRELGGKIARITALDPAGPLWNLNSKRVKPSDAIYVEAIHTDGGYTIGGLGIGFDVADADFYVNGGIDQPGCLTNICNHNRAWKYFAASVSYNHLIGNECSSSLQITLNRCRGEKLHMGNNELRKFPSGSGRYRANTRRRYPY